MHRGDNIIHSNRYVPISPCNSWILGLWKQGKQIFFWTYWDLIYTFLRKRFILYHRDFFTSQISSCLRQWFKNTLLEYNFFLIPLLFRYRRTVSRTIHLNTKKKRKKKKKKRNQNMKTPLRFGSILNIRVHSIWILNNWGIAIQFLTLSLSLSLFAYLSKADSLDLSPICTISLSLFPWVALDVGLGPN